MEAVFNLVEVLTDSGKKVMFNLSDLEQVTETENGKAKVYLKRDVIIYVDSYKIVSEYLMRMGTKLLYDISDDPYDEDYHSEEYKDNDTDSELN